MLEAKVTAAIEYARRGWVVHRLHSPTAKVKSPGKQPVDMGWQTVTTPPTETKLTEWFGNGNPKAYNIGLVCGEASDVTVIDLDREIYADVFGGIDTLRSSRTAGRGHVFFKYNPRLKAIKRHNLGIEVLTNGNNVVLPPSIHVSGDVYHWENPDAPIAEMPEEVETKLINLFEREQKLNRLVKKCRPCFSRLFKKEIRETTDFHGAEGRELMVAWGADLKAADATPADAEMWAKIIYGDTFDRAKTLTEWRNIDPAKTWKCETIAGKLGGVIECDCKNCKWKSPKDTSKSQPAKAPMADMSSTDTSTRGSDRLSFTEGGSMIWRDDDLSVVCDCESVGDGLIWSYFIQKGNLPLTKKITSKKAPNEDDPRTRDARMRQQVENAGDISVKDVMNVFDEFGLYLMANPDILEMYITGIRTGNHTDHDAQDLTKYRDIAIGIMETGDPVDKIISTFNSIHLGDEEIGKILMLSVGAQSIRNSAGIQPKSSGGSGKGKSHAGKTMLHLIPNEYWIATSLSAKAMFYADIKPGMIVFSDDVTISDNLQSTIKRATSDYQTGITHTTVDANREPIELHIPPRITWWLASVDDDYDMQMLNRQIGVGVDESQAMDEKVAEQQKKMAKEGRAEFPVTCDVLVCREIYRLVKEQFWTVIIPFVDNIIWADTRNRRNLPIFLDMIKSFCVMRFMQRKVRNDGVLVADREDFDDALVLYQSRAETQTTKLTRSELDIIRVIQTAGYEVDSKYIQKELNLEQARVHQLIHGQKGGTGLLGKVPGLHCEKITETDSEDRRVSKNIYTIDGFDLLGSYGSVVGWRE